MTRGLRAVAALVMCTLVLGACSDGDGGGDAAPVETTAPDGATTTSTAPKAAAFGVGVWDETFTDASRATPPSGDQPATDERVLNTIVFYPAAGDPTDGAVPDLEPATENGPFPLIIFSHGLGGTPEFSQPVIERWVSAGFVVVAPRFPLSRPDNPAGPDAGDVQNQTGDVRFLIDAVLEASVDPDSPVAGLIDRERIGASGHSNGAITTIGVTLHTCCVDDRIEAAVAFAGTGSPFAGGEYEWSLAPPFLIVHGTLDEQVGYSTGVALYNNLAGPKGLLTLDGGDHVAMFDPDRMWLDEVAAATTDFFLAYLADDAAALGRLQAPGAESGYPNLRFDDGAGELDLVPTTTVPGLDREVSVEPATGLVDGQSITVTWSGFSSDGTINVVQCSDADEGAGFCELTTGKILVPNPTGAGTLDLEIVVGPVGEGTCGPSITECVIAVNDSGLSDPDATIYVPLQFAD
jgi:dienelactone hydrolase